MLLTPTRRALITTIAALAFVGIAAGPSAAHFCFKTSVNERAAAGMAGSSNWVKFSDIAAEELPGLCPAGVAYVANAAGATPDTLIDGHGTMAGGTLRKGADAGNKAISYLDIDALLASVEDAYELCAD
jgi:hypothetical protein